MNFIVTSETLNELIELMKEQPYYKVINIIHKITSIPETKTNVVAEQPEIKANK